MKEAKPNISVISPSIRPEGLAVVFGTLKKQELNGITFEWLPRLSIPGKKPDLAYQMNCALKEAKGELVVFLQDWIKINPRGLQSFWDAYIKEPEYCLTSPVGKIKEIERFAGFEVSDDALGNKNIHWDWRAHREFEDLEYHMWEIDWGCGPKDIMLKAGLFDESFDDGFGWENVDLAYRIEKAGGKFACLKDNLSVAYDHDFNIEHPFKGKPNQFAWMTKKAMLDLKYGDS